MKRWPTIPVAPRMPIFCRCMILFPISEDVHQGPHRSCAGLFAVRTSVTVSYTGMHPRNCGSKEKRPLHSRKGPGFHKRKSSFIAEARKRVPHPDEVRVGKHKS